MECKNIAQIVIALLVTAGFFFCTYHMLNKTFPAENKDALNGLLGVLTTIFTLQMNYFFGSSSSSRAKDDTINEIAKSVPASIAAPTVAVKPTEVTLPDVSSVNVDTKDVNINTTTSKEN